MKSLCLTAMLCWLVGLTAISSDPNNRIYNGAVDSVVLVESEVKVDVERITTRTGTGFVVNGRLLTCYHIVEGATEVSIIDRSGRRQGADVGKVWKEKDLAELIVRRPPPSLRLAGKLSPQTKVWQLGHPADLRFVLTEGRFLTNNGHGNIFDITTNFGNSGSPLLNRKGEVVGMTQAIMIRNPRYTFGATIEDLREFLK